MKIESADTERPPGQVAPTPPMRAVEGEPATTGLEAKLSRVHEALEAAAPETSPDAAPEDPAAEAPTPPAP